MSITKEELTDLKWAEQDAHTARQLVIGLKARLAEKCDHPQEYLRRQKGWETCDYDVCTICWKERSVGSRRWHEPGS